MYSSSLYGNRHSKPESNTQDEKHELKKQSLQFLTSGSACYFLPSRSAPSSY